MEAPAVLKRMDALLEQPHGVCEACFRPGGYHCGHRGAIVHIEAGSRQRGGSWRTGVFAADHHASIEGQEFESKQSCLDKSPDDYVALPARPVPYTFPRPEEPRRKGSPFGRARRKLNPST